MGKSAVLKDLSNRPAGYMRLVQERVMVRAQLKEAAQLRVVFSDGSSREYALDGGSGEQCFSCGRSDAVGGFVFRKEELLLISDEAMRSAFAREISKEKAGKAQKKQERQNMGADTRDKPKEKRPALAQRRWPPPPCWEAARYREGAWREE